MNWTRYAKMARRHNLKSNKGLPQRKLCCWLWRHRFGYTVIFVCVVCVFINISKSFTPSFKYDVSTSSYAVAVTNKYVPSSVEKFITDHAVDLGYKDFIWTCGLWTNFTNPISGEWTNSTTPLISQEHFEALTRYRTVELPEYNRLLDEFQEKKNIDDLRMQIRGGQESVAPDYSVCDSLDLHPGGLRALFPSGVLSRLDWLSKGSNGFVEPMLPPFRNPDMCFIKGRKQRDNLFNLKYLVHDFAAMCRSLKPHSRTVLIDMGASLDFYSDRDSPAVYLTQLYRAMGFHFDHIYAYEIDPKEPNNVYQKIPDELKPAYHWYNVGVNASLDSPNNPLNILLNGFDEDDFVVIKLDIDNRYIERPMASLLLKEELANLVDVFYFEHHHKMRDMITFWGKSVTGASILDSLELFTTLRQKGIAAHSWV